MKFPSIDEFQCLPHAEQDRIRAAMAAETAELTKAVQEREAQLRAAGADWNEICRDMRGDPSVAEKYGLPTGSTEETCVSLATIDRYLRQKLISRQKNLITGRVTLSGAEIDRLRRERTQ